MVADWDQGIIRVRAHGKAVRVFERSRATGLIQVSEGVGELNLDIRYAEMLANINFSE